MPPSKVLLVPIEIVKVADGDSFSAVVNGIPTACRLFGVDAPEMDQPFGRQAKAELALLALGKTLQGRIITIDCYYRLVVDVWAFSTIRLGILMLRAGMAWHTPRWSPDRLAFTHAQHAARMARKGLWIDPDPVPPWTWRRLQGYRTMHQHTSRRSRVKRP